MMRIYVDVKILRPEILEVCGIKKDIDSYMKFADKYDLFLRKEYDEKVLIFETKDIKKYQRVSENLKPFLKI